MPRSPKDNQEIRDARREEILEAAARVFAEKGFARTKISDIAAAAGLSYGLVYHYFDGKAAVFAAIVDAMIARIEERLEVPGASAYERLVTSLDRSRDLIASCERHEADRLVAQAMLQGSVPEEVRERVQAHIESVRRRSTEWIAQAQADGDIDPSTPPEELASALMLLMRGMSIRMPGMPDPPLVIPRTETILRLLLPRTEPKPVRESKPRAARSKERTEQRPKKASTRATARRATKRRGPGDVSTSEK